MKVIRTIKSLINRDINGLQNAQSSVLMAAAIWVVAGVLAPYSFAAESGLTDKLLAQQLNNHLPKVLFKAAAIPWPAGTYGLNIEKMGDAKISSSDSTVVIQLPLKTYLKGNVYRDMGLAKINLNCDAAFDSQGVLTLIPKFSVEGLTFESNLDFPIPAVLANCDGIQFPIESALRQLVEANKPQWEADINAMFTENFKSKQI